MTLDDALKGDDVERANLDVGEAVGEGSPQLLEQRSGERCAMSAPTRSALSRLAAYTSALDDAASSHCMSSTAITTGVTSESARSTFKKATPTACGSGGGPSSSSSSTNARRSAR